MAGSLRRVSCGLLAVSALGCATIINSSDQTVEITSNPPGAKVKILPGGIELTTPCDVELRRRMVHTVLFELEGYQHATGYLDRTDSKVTLWNVIVGGVIGLAVDRGTGAIYRLIPDPLHVDLVPVAPPAPAEVHGDAASR